MIKTTALIAALYALACLFLYLKQRDLLYFPTPEAAIPNTPVMWLEHQQHRLKVWQIGDGENAIIYFGGNAESVDNNIELFSSLLKGYSVYLLNYRGYGGSSGTPSQQALFDDALALYDHLKDRHSTISVIGRSLGTGVATFLANEKPVKKLLLITPYDSLQNVAQSHYPLFPVRWLIKDPFNSFEYAKNISSQVLVLIAEHDSVIPRKYSENLVSSMKHLDVNSQVLSGTQHNDISLNQEFYSHLNSFFKSYE